MASGAIEIETNARSWAQLVQNETVSNVGLRTDAIEREELFGDASLEASTSKCISLWCQNNGNFRSNLTILKSDLILPKPMVKVVDNYLWLDEDDFTPIELGWEYCLFGFFASRFPNKDAVQKLRSRWTRKCRISYHPNGWMIFRFETEDDTEFIQKVDRHEAAGVPLILCNLPQDFRFDSTPEVKFRVWITLLNLLLGLWNQNAIRKIASMLGDPVEVEYKTVSKNSIVQSPCSNFV